MNPATREPNRGKLRALVVLSLVVAAMVAMLFWNRIGGAEGMGWVSFLIVGTLAVISYGAAFYISVLMFENTLEQFIVSDTFKRKNKWIDVETETRASPDRATDAWVKHYVFARQILAIGILPFLACIYLFWIA